jgi:hypothetical protein
MEPVGTIDDLRFLAPQECVWWAIETDYEGTWKRRSLAPGRQGPREKFWHVDRLSVETVRSLFGPGRHRLLYYRDNKRSRLGTSRPLDIPEESPDTLPSQPEPDELAAELAAATEAPELGGFAAVDIEHEHLDGSPLHNLDPERLAAVVQGRPADTDPVGRAMGIIERLNALHASMYQTQFAHVKHEAALQVARAKAEVEMIRVQERERANAAIEQSRMFYERTAELSEKAHQIEAEARNAQTGDEIDDMRATLQGLLEAFQAQQQQAGAELNPAEQNALSHMIATAGPSILKMVAAKFLNGGPQAAAAMAAAAPEGGAELGGVLDAIAPEGN